MDDRLLPRQLRDVRPVNRRYRDPLEQVWLGCAARMGLRIERSDEVFAAYDGEGTLTLGRAELDADDCLAQMIFHELCHSLVQGPGAFEEPDWGLDNQGDQHTPREHACLRLQAALLDAHGLREVLAPTTEHRAFYDRLGTEPLVGESAVHELARAARACADALPYAPHLQRALAATRSIVEAASAFAAPGDLLRLT